MRPKTREAARGRWTSILTALGVADRALSGKHSPCPLGCGGTKSFRFDNREGLGTWICTHCGSNDGIGFVAQYLNITIPEAMTKVDSLVGNAQVDEQRQPDASIEDKVDRLRRVWESARPLDGADPASMYLRSRVGGMPLPRDVRVHSALPYKDDETGEVTRHPAMLALVRDAAGGGLTIHRTYLTNDGRKACVSNPKKLMQGKPVQGGAIRLARADKKLGIAEGIETALAASAMFDLPVWSAISANGIETFDPPEGIEEVLVFADNDDSYTGQLAAFTLANRLKVGSKYRARNLVVSVYVPPQPGQDWADVLKGKHG